MIRRSAPLVLIALVVGCGPNIGPDETLLAPGQSVVVASDPAFILVGDELPAKVGTGVRLTVGSDPGEWVEDPRDFAERTKAASGGDPFRVKPGGDLAGQRLAASRKIRVLVETGPLAGTSGEVYRKDVRPIP